MLDKSALYGPPAFMKFETFTRIVDQFVGLCELHLQGLGEPMMHPRFFDMVKYAAEKGISVSTNSNLTLLNEKRAELCVTSGLEYLHVSIDGATAETYERIRVRAHFERIVGNLERLLAARERLADRSFASPSPRPGRTIVGARLVPALSGLRPHVHMTMVIMRQNLHELPDLVRLAHKWSVELMFVQHLCHDFGESSLPAHYRPMREFVQVQTLLEEEPERVEYYFAEARKIAQELGVNLRLPGTQRRIHSPGTPGPERCDWPWSGAYISYQGYAMPCCMVSTPDRITFGNMAEQGVEAIWNGKDYQAFRDQLASDEPPEVCRSCSVYSGTF